MDDNTTELQSRLEAAEERARSAELGNLRRDIGAAHGISDEHVALLTGTDEATLLTQAQRLAEWKRSEANLGLIVPTEGSTPTPVPIGQERLFAARLFGREL
ncbi:hypothetical protein [Curtobacterium sp. GD1]|uniref:hypothetical protein n=1 Tax=Curtobacterium sp. GD1 TaxID=2810612 RepID=UPI001E5518DF|nr:hypothetical protein [Curtobacterium sp. GD1]MCC8909465.1 hypothetical protein [Curtobacterium sp. GD1]